ncbi:MAG: hypothetical protein WCO81_11100 [Cyanobacteriota bacterium ELA615]
MSLNSKLSKTATSAGLAILGVTQFNNKANSSIVYNNTSITAINGSPITWTLDSVSGYGAQFQLKLITGIGANSSTTNARIFNSTLAASLKGGRIKGAAYGANVSSVNPVFPSLVVAYGNSGAGGLPNATGYIAFKDITGNQTPIYGWAKWTTSNAYTLSITEWAYNSVPGGSITVGQKTGATDIPFDFNPLQGMALGVPVFLGLRQLKRRKAKKNAIVSIKRKEQIHPLALLGMGAAGVRKWRAQKDKDAA